MRIFVTGATGYIGQRLVVRLINQGHEVHALCRTNPEGELFQQQRIKIFRGDLLDRKKINEAIEGCEQVYHIAAYARIWAKHNRTFFETNVQGTVNVLEAALAAGIEKVVFTSTSGTFGISNGVAITEDVVRTCDFFTEYESSKFMAEEKVQHYVRKGLNIVIVNPVRVYGPGVFTESNPISRLIKAYVTGDWHIMPGDGKSISCFSFIDDVVDGHLLAMQYGIAGERYILGGENSDFNTFFSYLRDLSKHNYLLFRLPTRLMMFLGWQEELMAKWFGQEPFITRKWIRKYRYDMACSSEKAIHHLGYKITPLKEGIARTLSWLKDECQVYY